MPKISTLTEAIVRSDEHFTTSKFGDKYPDVLQCAAFAVDAACWESELKDPIGFFNGRSATGYPNAKNFYDQWKYEKGKTAKNGAILVYDGTHGGGYGHVGVVCDKDTGEIVEGNFDHKVFNKRKVNLNASDIVGYCYVPNYTEDTPTKSIEEVAKEVINGKWGNGVDRKNRLIAAGYDYDQVQTKVSELLHPTSNKKSVTEIAKEVINGKWGNGVDRKNKLIAAGYDYDEVQKEVSRLLHS